MAMQSGIGLSKILFLAGAGYTGTVMLKNGKLSDIIADIEEWLKTTKISGDQSHADPAQVLQEVRRLAMELRQVGSRQITVLNGNSGNATSFVAPVAAVGALGYAYMWWKGISFSDLMYVTKRNMANAVSNLTKHLEQVSDALAAAKRHLTQRIENVDDKVKSQIELSKQIEKQVGDVQKELSQVGWNLGDLQSMVSGLEGKMGALEAKQNFANAGVLYLCNFVDGKKGKMPEILQEQLKLSGSPRGLLTSPETPSLKGLKDIAETLLSGATESSPIDSDGRDGIHQMDDQSRNLMRSTSWRSTE